jgi:N-acylneuraminate cytidylyltransferase/CMP-N,N'-diacetyllegionaminic acid synthase
MYKGKTVLALIPARGGSKGLRGKNIMKFGSKPMIAWSIGHAKGSRYVDRTIVSTDEPDIARIAEQYGAEVPFMRPHRLATDGSKLMDAIIHAIDNIEAAGERYDILVLLQPTSPLRTSRDVDYAIKLLLEKNARSIVSVCEAEHHPYWVNSLPADGNMGSFLKKEAVNVNRQDLPAYYRLNGCVFVSYCDHLKKRASFYGAGSFAYVMPSSRSADIDNMQDFMLAQAMLKTNLRLDKR